MFNMALIHPENINGEQDPNIETCIDACKHKHGKILTPSAENIRSKDILGGPGTRCKPSEQ